MIFLHELNIAFHCNFHIATIGLLTTIRPHYLEILLLITVSPKLINTTTVLMSSESSLPQRLAHPDLDYQFMSRLNPITQLQFYSILLQ